jgi:hypothetical protein
MILSVNSLRLQKFLDKIDSKSEKCMNPDVLERLTSGDIVDCQVVVKIKMNF